MHQRTEGVSMHSGVTPVVYMFRMTFSIIAVWIREKILKIDWKSDDFSKFKEIKELNKESDEVIVFVKGKENYINNINENINNWGNLENLKIIDCYDVNELQEDITNISGKYNKVLSTSGISKL